MTKIDLCKNCRNSQSCLQSELPASEKNRWTNIIKFHPVLQRGHRLFGENDPFRSLYFIRSGSIKLWKLNADGVEHIIDFSIPGDVIGLAAIDRGYHDNVASTLETSSVCEIPFDTFLNLAVEFPQLSKRLFGILSQEIARDEHMVWLLSHKKALARLAFFLNKIANNYRVLGYSPRTINLTMARSDIANYLGLALETVSRSLSQLQQQSVIRVAGKTVEIMDPPRLVQLSGTAFDESLHQVTPRNTSISVH